jgi:hypothetical protein
MVTGSVHLEIGAAFVRVHRRGFDRLGMDDGVNRPPSHITWIDDRKVRARP